RWEVDPTWQGDSRQFIAPSPAILLSEDAVERERAEPNTGQLRPDARVARDVENAAAHLSGLYLSQAVHDQRRREQNWRPTLESIRKHDQDRITRAGAKSGAHEPGS